MNLIKFLMIGAILSISLGEFGQYPFGTANFSISLTDVLLTLSVFFFFIWQIGIKRELTLPPIFFGVVVFWLVALLSLLFSGNLNGGLYLIRFVLYSLSFLICYFLVKENKDSLGGFVNTFLISGVAVSILGVIQLLLFPDLQFLSDYGYDPHQNRLVSTFLDPNFAASFLNIILIFTLGFYHSSKKKIWFVITSAIAASVILTFSRSGLIMLIVEFLLFGFIKQRKLLIILTIFLIGIYLLVPRFSERINGIVNIDITARERIESWNKGLLIFYGRPVLGVGFNNLREAYKENNLLKVFSGNGGNSGAGSDSSIVFILATTGVVGFLIYFGWWIKVLVYLFKLSRSKSGIISFITLCFIMGLFLNGQFINSMFFPPIMLTYYSILGGIYGLQNKA